MTTTIASKYTSMSADDVMELLAPRGERGGEAESVDQDWDRETTTIRFADGSALEVCGTEVVAR